jgi:uncharacterized protein
VHARAVAALFAALGCANAWAANEADKPAFDCARAKNAAERMICADRSLAALDQRLARLYADTLALAFDRERLRASQLAWLRERDKCSTGDCIRTAYEQRIEAIEHSGEMTDTRAAAICTTVVQAINDGSIVSQFIAMDPESEGDRQRWAAGTRKDESLNGVKRLSIHGRARTFSLTASAGSCSSYSIGDMDAKVPYREPADAENDERLRWSSWGYDDHLMIVEGEPIVLTGGFGPQRWRGTLVSWIGTDGTTRPLCALDLSGRIETRILRAGDAALCAAAASGKVQAVAWEKSGVAIDDASRNARPMHVDAYQSARVDVDLDGKSDTIIRFEYASGAKCGSFHQWLRYAERVAASAPVEPRPEY